MLENDSNNGYIWVMIKDVILNNKVERALRKVPLHVVIKLQKWVDDVEEIGLEDVMKIKSYHDEPCKGSRKGQRLIRLSKAYRAFYIKIKGQIEFVEVQEVNKHEY